MARQRLLQISVLGLVLAASTAQASSVSISIGSHGVRFSASNRRPAVVRKHTTWRTRPAIVIRQPRIVVPRKRQVIVHKPVFTPVEPCVQPVTVTVWITNSNGSQSPVVLTKTPLGYKGPRGEYYDTFPSNRQLRRAYGF